VSRKSAWCLGQSFSKRCRRVQHWRWVWGEIGENLSGVNEGDKVHQVGHLRWCGLLGWRRDRHHRDRKGADLLVSFLELGWAPWWMRQLAESRHLLARLDGGRAVFDQSPISEDRENPWGLAPSVQFHNTTTRSQRTCEAELEKNDRETGVRPQWGCFLLEMDGVTVRVQGRLVDGFREGGVGVDGGVDVINGRL